MTRKSRRELERAVDDLDGGHDGPQEFVFQVNWVDPDDCDDADAGMNATILPADGHEERQGAGE